VDIAQLVDLVDRPADRSQVSSAELTQAFLDRIDAYQPVLNALITITADQARADARRVDACRARGERLLLDGMPILIKDNIAVANSVTTNGSKAFAQAVSERDAEAVRRLRAAGAVILGKTHLHELAFGVTSDSAYGICHNPWDLRRIPGGSSGGSAVAVAADLCIGALGTDTGGSVRLPASLTGVLGLRPTAGAVSTRGVYPLAQTFDTVGPMARSARDAGLIFEAMAGYDAADPWSRVPRERVDRFDDSPSIVGLRIGVAREYFFDEVDPDVNRCVEEALRVFADLGAKVTDVNLDGAARAYEVYARMVAVEAFSNYESLLSDPKSSIRSDIRQRLEAGSRVSATDVVKMRRFMAAWRRAVDDVLKNVDVIATPVSPKTAPLLTDGSRLEITESLTKNTRPWSLARLPALSLPCGFGIDGLPVGIQLTSGAWSERLPFRIAEVYQRVTDWHQRRPALLRDGSRAL
jgi:aspartyl-tRNA(Asn)/glutamyl-tRNA(Gln) amidotransferase subunit A